MEGSAKDIPCAGSFHQQVKVGHGRNRACGRGVWSGGQAGGIIRVRGGENYSIIQLRFFARPKCGCVGYCNHGWYVTAAGQYPNSRAVVTEDKSIDQLSAVVCDIVTMDSM